MPTILGLMGLEVPEECDGKNLSKPIFSGNENAVDFVPVWLYEGKGFRGVITREYTFATQKGATAGSLHSVLFDRVNDPCQLNNRFADPSMNAVREKLWKITADQQLLVLKQRSMDLVIQLTLNVLLVRV